MRAGFRYKLQMVAGSTVLCLFLLTVVFCSLSMAEVLGQDTTWRGVVEIGEDVIVPAGVTLTVVAGTEVRVVPAESTKIDPEYFSHQTEILVRGRLLVLGNSAGQVSFSLPGAEQKMRWAGIVVDGGELEIASCHISGAETGVYVVSGRLQGTELVLDDNRYGLVVQGAASHAELRSSSIKGNDYGVMLFAGAQFERHNSTVASNSKKDIFTSVPKLYGISLRQYQVPKSELTRIYNNETLMGVTVWRGRILVQGQLRLAPKGRLIIMPGTVVQFSKRDTNGDGIGENGILIQGALVAKGTSEKPIIFRSAESDPQMGDWDSINILGSDQTRNLIEFCQIENAYRGLHFHFSNVAVTSTVLRDNYRGAQFQESVVEMRDNQLYHNKSALQCRDSEVLFKNNKIVANINGANLFRLNLKAYGNVFANNLRDGLRVREGMAVVEHNIMVGNRVGMVVADAVFGKFDQNLLAGNLENGLTLKNVDGLEVKGNAMLVNGLNGININQSRGVISDSMIVANGERGIGILSFNGRISENNIAANGRYAIGLDGSDDLAAPDNWWGGSDLDREIFDHHDDPALGQVDFGEQRSEPHLFVWPVPEVPINLPWLGALKLVNSVTVLSGAVLTIRPDTEILLDKDIGMKIFGSIKGDGEPGGRIKFTSVRQTGPGDWGEISLDRAVGSYFKYCDFEFAEWAVHCHYSEFKISSCSFTNNQGGFRFRSGPVVVEKSLFSNNYIGLRAYIATADIHGNIFTKNEIGIFIREKGSGVRVNYNGIFANDRYGMRLGDFNDENVDARHNWWGGKKVEDAIFDGRSDSYIGKVIFEPELDKPVKLDWLD